MALSSLVIKAVPTSYTVTGGTAQTLVPLQNDWDSLVLGNSADTDLRTRRTYNFDLVNPKVNIASPSGYTQQRFKSVVKKPKTLANSKITVNTGKIEFGFDVETTVAEKTAMLDDMTQMLLDANFRSSVINSSTV